MRKPNIRIRKLIPNLRKLKKYEKEEIISAVYDFLQHTTFDQNVKVLRVICDGCSGQNKNTGMVVMLGKWLYSEAPRHVKKVELIFPVVGHSFIPPDRVFAKIEKTLKKKVVTCPSEYVSKIGKKVVKLSLNQPLPGTSLL